MAARWLALSVLTLAPRTAAVDLDPAACASNVVTSIDNIVNAAYDITQASVDCTLPGLDELSCSSDLTDMMSYWFNLGVVVAGMTLTCGNLDNACAANVLQALGDMSDVSNNLVAAANDCTNQPFICTYDVVSAVDAMNGFVGDIIYSLQTCNQGPIPPVDLDGGAWNGFGIPVDSGFYERRLKEADAKAPKEAAPVSTTEVVPQRAADSTKYVDLAMKFKSDLQQLHTIVQRRKVQTPEADGAAERQAAFETLREKARAHRQVRAAAPVQDEAFHI